MAQEIHGAGGRTAKAFQDERHQILGGVILGAVAGMLMVNISCGRAAWLAGTAANFGDVSCTDQDSRCGMFSLRAVD